MLKDEIEKLDEESINERIKEVLEGGDLLKVKDDRTFHLLFNSVDNDALTWFMAKILDKNINDIKKVIKLENSALKPLNKYDKGKSVDFIVDVGDDVIIVEMNNNSTGRDYTRNLYYAFHALLTRVEIGNDYQKRHAILINLNWFKEKDDKYKPVDIIEYPYPILGKEKEESIITVKNINLSYYDKMLYTGVEMKGFQWKLFTINKISELEDVRKNVKELDNYCNELKRISESREYCMHVWSDRIEKNLSGLADFNDGKKLGIQEGKELGIWEIKKSIIANMCKNNMTLDEISKSTGISIEEVNKIIDSINN